MGNVSSIRPIEGETKDESLDRVLCTKGFQDKITAGLWRPSRIGEFYKALDDPSFTIPSNMDRLSLMELAVALSLKPVQEDDTTTLDERLQQIQRSIIELSQNPTKYPPTNDNPKISIWEAPVTLQQLVFGISIPILLLAASIFLPNFMHQT